MSQSNFHDENRGRAYPFLFQTIGVSSEAGTSVAPPSSVRGLDNDFIVDCGFRPGPTSQFSYSHHVRLSEVQYDSGAFKFTFVSNAPGLIDSPLVFSVPEDTPDFGTVTAASLSSAESEESPALCSYTVWDGFLVVGSLSRILRERFYGLPDSWSVSGDAAAGLVEPSRIRSQNQDRLFSLGLANADRTRVVTDNACVSESQEYDPGHLFVVNSCLSGKLVFADGYNVSVQQQTGDNTIVFTPGVGLGRGVPCEEVPTHTDETAPDGSPFLSGGLACNETLRSVNGIGGPLLTLRNGPGIDIVSNPEEHTIIIDIDLTELAFCFSERSDALTGDTE